MKIRVHRPIYGVPVEALDSLASTQFAILGLSKISREDTAHPDDYFWVNVCPYLVHLDDTTPSTSQNGAYIVMVRQLEPKRIKVRIHRPVWGVPITFLNKWNSAQFEIVAFRKGNDDKDLSYTSEREYNHTPESSYDICNGSNQECRGQDRREDNLCKSNHKTGTAHFGLITGATQTRCTDGKARYSRVAIRSLLTQTSSPSSLD